MFWLLKVQRGDVSSLGHCIFLERTELYLTLIQLIRQPKQARLR